MILNDKCSILQPTQAGYNATHVRFSSLQNGDVLNAVRIIITPVIMVRLTNGECEHWVSRTFDR
jgi:hypothetical protein